VQVIHSYFLFYPQLQRRSLLINLKMGKKVKVCKVEAIFYNIPNVVLLRAGRT